VNQARYVKEEAQYQIDQGGLDIFGFEKNRQWREDETKNNVQYFHDLYFGLNVRQVFTSPSLDASPKRAGNKTT
jgi:hypothetical protein